MSKEKKCGCSESPEMPDYPDYGGSPVTRFAEDPRRVAMQTVLQCYTQLATAVLTSGAQEIEVSSLIEEFKELSSNLLALSGVDKLTRDWLRQEYEAQIEEARHE